MSDMHDARMRTYLNDHMAATVGALELARRSRSRNRDQGQLPVVLDELIGDLENDRETLGRLLHGINGSQARLKQGGAWLLEKLGRLKVNDSVFRYTDLDRVYELEALIAHVYSKRALWRTLAAYQRDDERLRSVDVAQREARDEDLLEALHVERGMAAATAFGLAPAEVEAAGT